MKHEKTRKILDYLMQPVGLKIYKHYDGIFQFQSIEFPRSFVTCVCVDDYVDNFYANVNDAITTLFNSAKYFRIPNEHYMYHYKVQNPYLGCRSLEEAMIRRDLLGDKTEEDA